MTSNSFDSWRSSRKPSAPDFNSLLVNAHAASGPVSHMMVKVISVQRSPVAGLLTFLALAYII